MARRSDVRVMSSKGRIFKSMNMEYPKDLSIIVPLFNEKESLPELLAWIRSVMDANKFSY